VGLIFFGECFAMIERRAFDRIPVNQLALVSFDRIRGVHPATVRDISALGACISAPYYIFAHEFELSFDGFHRIFVCRVAWKTGTICGVSFVSRPEASDTLAGHPDFGIRPRPKTARRNA
jgi:hypothetical protein